MIIENDEEKKKKLQSDISRLCILLSLQNLLLDNQLSALLANHRDYEKLKPDIEKYEKALDLRAKSEIQNIYLHQALNMDFSRKFEVNQLTSEQKK